MDQPTTILLVEDDPALAELVGLALRPLDVTIRHAANGAEALQALAGGEPPRLVLLDLDLPDIRGLEVLDQARGDDPSRAVPFVVLSSSEEEEDIARAAALGANSYVVKPADFEAFRERVARTVTYWLELHRAPGDGDTA